jgi:hypothetical protein
MAHFDRRSFLVRLGAAAVIFGKTSRVLAQQQFEGVKRIRYKEFPSMIPGVAKIALREVEYQPGAKSSRTMPYTMVCECTAGVLHVTQDTMTTAINTGEFWTCHKGMEETVDNRGSVPAVMRVIELVPA